MKSCCIVQARTNSSRLPNKVLLPLNGHTVIGEVLTRCQQIPVDQVVCTVPTDDDRLAREAFKYCDVMRGPENDVLLRYLLAATECEADVIMRITADCPLLSPGVCGAVLEKFFADKADYASNVHPRTFPQGYDCEVFSYDLLRRADEGASERQREHVTTWMLGASAKRVNLTAPWSMNGRLTLDTLDDYRTICAAFGHKPFEHIRSPRAA